MTKALSQIDKKAIEAYLFPELENMRALLENLGLQASLSALIFLQNILKYELQKRH